MKNEPTFESIAESVWEELTREATAGFPLLSAIPATGVVRFLDSFESRNEAGRERLLHDLALLAAFAIQRRGERPQAWAVDRMRTALAAPGPSPAAQQGRLRRHHRRGVGQQVGARLQRLRRAVLQQALAAADPVDPVGIGEKRTSL